MMDLFHLKSGEQSKYSANIVEKWACCAITWKQNNIQNHSIFRVKHYIQSWYLVIKYKSCDLDLKEMQESYLCKDKICYLLFRFFKISVLKLKQLIKMQILSSISWIIDPNSKDWRMIYHGKSSSWEQMSEFVFEMQYVCERQMLSWRADTLFLA